MSMILQGRSFRTIAQLSVTQRKKKKMGKRVPTKPFLRRAEHCMGKQSSPTAVVDSKVSSSSDIFKGLQQYCEKVSTRGGLLQKRL